jgi:hypothetical protein
MHLMRNPFHEYVTDEGIRDPTESFGSAAAQMRQPVGTIPEEAHYEISANAA